MTTSPGSMYNHTAEPGATYLLNSEDNEVYATPLGTPAWYIVNLRLGYQLTSVIRFQAGIDNALDLQYRTFSSGINAPGRNIFVVVRLAI